MERLDFAERSQDLGKIPAANFDRQLSTLSAGVRDFFNRRACDWDLTIDEQTSERSRRLVLSLDILPGERVLDVGCGTGILIPWLLEAVGEEGSICAVDIAEEMLRIARRKQWRPNLQYLRVDIADTPFLDESFDLIVCHNCFPHITDKEGAVREMYRILRPGGRAVISHTESRESINARHRRIGGVVGGDMLPSESVMRRLFQRVGFAEINVRDESDGYLFKARKPDTGWHCIHIS